MSPSTEAVLTYDRASADVASSLPALLRKHPGAPTFSVRNSQTEKPFDCNLSLVVRERVTPGETLLAR
jgi:hypothetical protein